MLTLKKFNSTLIDLALINKNTNVPLIMNVVYVTKRKEMSFSIISRHLILN